jgi:hypothetical protein
VHASDPSEHKTFGLDVLELQDSEELQVHMLEFMVLDLDDTLQNGSVVFRVGVDFGLDCKICFGFIHVALDVNNFLKNTENIAFGMFDRIKEQMTLPKPT